MKNRRWAIQFSDGKLYAGCDYTTRGVVKTAGYVSSPGGKPWPVATWPTVEKAGECVLWLGKYGKSRFAQIVQVRPVRTWVPVTEGSAAA